MIHGRLDITPLHSDLTHLSLKDEAVTENWLLFKLISRIFIYTIVYEIVRMWMPDDTTDDLSQWSR